MPDDDTEYYRQRAFQERELRDQAPSKMVADIHEKLALHYDEMASDPSKRGVTRAHDIGPNP